MVLTVAAVALPFLPLVLALLYARRDDEWKSITERERFNHAFTFSVPVSAWTYGAGVRAGTAPHGAGADASRATSCLASEGRPATAPISSLRAKVDRPIPAVVALPVATAGKFDRTAHAPRAHAGSVAPSR